MNESILKTLSVIKGLKRSKKGIFTSKSQISLRVEMQGDTSNYYFADLTLICGLINLIETLDKRKGNS